MIKFRIKVTVTEGFTMISSQVELSIMCSMNTNTLNSILPENEVTKVFFYNNTVDNIF